MRRQRRAPVAAPVMRLLGAPVAALRLLGAPVEEPSAFPVALRASGHMVGPAVEEEAFPEIDWTGLAFCVGFVLLCLATELLTTAGAATPAAAAPPAAAATPAPARRTRAAAPRAARPTRVRTRTAETQTTPPPAEPEAVPVAEPVVTEPVVAEPVVTEPVVEPAEPAPVNPWNAFQHQVGGAGPQAEGDVAAVQGEPPGLADAQVELLPVGDQAAGHLDAAQGADVEEVQGDRDGDDDRVGGVRK